MAHNERNVGHVKQVIELAQEIRSKFSSLTLLLALLISTKKERGSPTNLTKTREPSAMVP